MDERELPFYIIGHNPNTEADARAFLAAGANALEPDIQQDKYGTLLAAHTTHELHPTQLGLYLEGLRRLENEFSRFSLVVFDSKLGDAHAGARVHSMVREYMYGSKLRFIYSVAKLDMIDFLRPIAKSLAGNEGVMIDEESDVDAVVKALQGLGADHVGYGDGIYVSGIKSKVKAELDRAIAKRAMSPQRLPQFIDTWTLASNASLRDAMQAGVDGAIVNLSTVSDALDVLREFEPWRPLATREHDPFLPTKGGRMFVAVISTLDRTHAGTDAAVAVRLGGSGKTVLSTIVDGRPPGRFEAGSTTPVTLPESIFDVGTPQWIELGQDGTGNAPDWLPDRVTLAEQGQPALFADFGMWIKKGGPHQRVQLGGSTYVVEVQTSNKANSGTDADITFTLIGANGSVQRRVNGHPTGWFETGSLNTFDIRGVDVGALQQIRVENDGSGNAPGWHLDWIKVVPDTGQAARTFQFNAWIEGGGALTAS